MTSEAIQGSGFVHVETVRDVVVITFSRAEKLNAMSRDMRVEIAALIREHGDGARARGIVLTGEGRAFSAGEDLSATDAGDGAKVLESVESFHNITRAILSTRVPVVAAVNGLAVGGASEVTMCCDSRIGSESAEYFMPENKIGLTISNASSILLRRLVGNHATRVILGSPRLGAVEALRIGLLDQVVPADVLVKTAIDLIVDWTPEEGATNLHLQLLRPTPADIEAAIARENTAAAEAWESGVIAAGVDRFWESKAVRP